MSRHFGQTINILIKIYLKRKLSTICCIQNNELQLLENFNSSISGLEGGNGGGGGGGVFELPYLLVPATSEVVPPSIEKYYSRFQNIFLNLPIPATLGVSLQVPSFPDSITAAFQLPPPPHSPCRHEDNQ